MRRIKLMGLAIFAVVALSAFAAATASAEDPEFSPGAEGSTFEGTSGEGTLTATGGTIVCKKDSTKGELTTEHKLANATVDFSECAAFSIFGAHTLEDKEGIILVKVNLHLCYINKAKKEVGVLTEITSKDAKEGKEVGIHVEVAGKLIEIKGDQVGQITPVNTDTKEFNIIYKNPPVQCEGKTEHLLAQENEKGAFENAFEATTEKVKFAELQTLVA